MNLRRQLIVVSLLTLSLPWAGCQYIQEMEQAMRQGQVIALEATATAVAKRIGSEELFQQQLQAPQWRQPAESQLYVHELTSPMFLDGYDDEWRHLEIAPKPFSDENTQAHWQLSLGKTSAQFMLFAKVTDSAIFYHNPGLDDLASGDHFRLRVLLENGAQRDYVIRSGAPGEVTAYYRDGRRIRQEPRLRGFWQENASGFQLELAWPKNLLGDNLGVAFVNVDKMPRLPVEKSERRQVAVARQWLGNIGAQESPPFWVGVSHRLADAVSVFTSNGIRLRVVSANHWLLANVGKLQQPRGEEYETHGLMRWLYRLFLGENFLPALTSPELSGRLLEAEILSAQINDQASSGWYQWGVRRVARAVVPIGTGASEHDSHLVASVIVAEQSSDAMMALTDNAFSRLLFYTLCATLVTGVGLLAYASWLSYRIRKLSAAAATAVDENGRISDSFPQSNAADEIGELTRHYAQLLERLSEYTDYLRTLSSKLSHELRTPLAVVRSSLDNLEHENLSESASIYAKRAQDGSERLSSILNAMSSASRVEASIDNAEKEFIQLDDLIKQVGAAYNDMLEHCQVEVFVDERVANVEYLVAPDLLVQMLDKLVDNASDFCPQQGVIKIQLLPSEKGILLSVSNDGPLLPELMKHQLFDSLVSIRAAAKEQESMHLGLGLHIVRLIVEFHGGTVRAFNRNDLSGVVFEVSLPSFQ
jgi:two-component system, OmpR family, sensor histidine kinase ChvG